MCVAGASAVRVRLDVGQPTEIDVQAEGWWADPEGHHGTDLAVVMIPADVTAGRDVELARFGRISDCTAVLAVQAFGLPAVQAARRPCQHEASGRCSGILEQVTGHAPVAANRRQGTLAVYLDDPPPAAPERGALAVGGNVGGRGLGRRPDRRGRGRTSLQRGHRSAHRPAHRPGLRTAAGVLTSTGSWTGSGCPRPLGGLPDVVPAEPGQLVRSAYLEQVRDIAPDELIGRESELAEWAEFCAGPRPTPGGRLGRGQVRARWRRGSSPIPRPGSTSCRSSSPAALLARPTATRSWMP